MLYRIVIQSNKMTLTTSFFSILGLRLSLPFLFICLDALLSTQFIVCMCMHGNDSLYPLLHELRLNPHAKWSLEKLLNYPPILSSLLYWLSDTNSEHLSGVTSEEYLSERASETPLSNIPTIHFAYCQLNPSSANVAIAAKWITCFYQRPLLLRG